ncbi:MAG TPA: hypothetical protein VGO82_07080 [Enterovirga sp.]|nr:hypothetical protein [Enterovirga sp.]
MLADTISLRGEYLHYDLGRVRSTSQPAFGGAFGNFTYDTRLKTDVQEACELRLPFQFLNWAEILRAASLPPVLLSY